MNEKMKSVVLWGIALLVCSPIVVAQTANDPIAVPAKLSKAIDNHDLNAIAACFADDGVLEITYLSEPLDTKEKIKASFADMFMHSPDAHTTSGLVLAAGNVAVDDHAIVGTNTGVHPTIPTTGKSWVGPHLDVIDIDGNGKIKKLMAYGDLAGFMIQLGLMPAPEMPKLVPSVPLPAPAPTGLSPIKANAELVRRWNSHDAVLVAKMLRADFQSFAGPLGKKVDRAAMTALNELYFTAFPQVEAQVRRTIDLGSGWVLTELLCKGSHLASFMGVPASGYLAEIPAAWLTRYDATGLATEQSFYYDNLTLMTQITTPEWSPEGQWISASPTPLGNLMITGVWIAQGADKTRFLGQYKEVNMLPLFTDLYPGAEAISFAGEQAIKIGRNKYQMSFMLYYKKTAAPGFEKIVGLGSVSGTFDLTGPDTIRGQATGAYYLAAQDADQDGFPDEGQKPALCVPWTWICKRPPMMPGCVLTPMP